MKVSDAQRIGKRAAQFGTTAAMKYFADKYPNDPQFASLKETTVRRWKDQYKAALLLKDGGSDDDSQSQECQELYLKRTGWPLKLEKELDKQVREYVQDLRAKGTGINTAVVIISAESILLHKDANLLKHGWMGEVSATTYGICEEEGNNTS